MLFGQSIFQSVVERLSLEEEEKPDDASVARAYRVSGLSTGFVQDNGLMQQAAADWAQDQYLDLMSDDILQPAPPAIPEMPAHLGRLGASEIADDLGLKDADDVAALQAKRRAFAMTNHPDRVHAAFAEAAHTRMTIANQLVDEALQRRALRHG
ncbi:hypothetical protein [Allorhizobium terrae]|uniref:J domain-containing protein n=1 Tax=Allorhizobium terrae TaxID=1848972 RepID=A0A4S4A5A0_9HYPH|nr:hypothetical protein [Allorhizobium terrae]THF53698.1 hypothetical protein E6C51_00830 [Allorhizobium terrae]TWD54262.1 hypothetical protein FB480_103170 [Agrobacterium vitis]